MDVHPIQLLKGKSRPQHEWYNHFAATCSSEYWVGIHEEMIFLSDGWLSDLVGFMEAYPETYVLGGDYFPHFDGSNEPVSGEIVNLRESLSAWIFCVRKGLRDHTSTSFSFYTYSDDAVQQTIAYDQGGKLMEDMRRDGLGFACMPDWFTRKWQHVANATWAFNTT